MGIEWGGSRVGAVRIWAGYVRCVWFRGQTNLGGGGGLKLKEEHQGWNFPPPKCCSAQISAKFIG